MWYSLVGAAALIPAFGIALWSLQFRREERASRR
jgi:hypothetical protein